VKNIKYNLLLTFIFILLFRITNAQGSGADEEMLSADATNIGPLDDGQGTVPIEREEWMLILSGLSLGMYRIYRVWSKDGR
jgi:hypothetical protein